MEVKTYYDETGKALGQAWSPMKCAKRRGVNHKPHSHNPQFTVYGPYMCPGFPEKDLYTTPLRVPEYKAKRINS